MKKIINELLYDTEKSEFLLFFRKKVKVSPVFTRPDYNFESWNEMELYKSSGGRFFAYAKDTKTIVALEVAEARAILGELNPDKYIELFGGVTEA